MTVRIILGDCLDVLKVLPDNSIDSIVTDPPYGLSFMGKRWDYDVPSVEIWAECFRVLKPGGHLLSFAGTRTYHRMACAIEDAGFEIRDQIGWCYGSGFPKSHNVGKSLEKLGLDPSDWDGWGTALKPAWEPIVVARKPLSEKSVAANVLEHGTGALNIDGCRVPLGSGEKPFAYPNGRGGEGWHGRESLGANLDVPVYGNEAGRWPANLIHDGSDEVLALFPYTKSGKPGIMRKGANDGACYGAESRPPGTPMTGFGDSGSAARFFYCPKASKKDRAGSKHPTVKPLDLMRYLCRLVTPPGGTVLDPFAGSGTTGQAAVEEGFRAVLIEREAEYIADIRRRLLGGDAA